MKKFLFSLMLLFACAAYTYSQALIVKNATPQDMVLTDFVYIDVKCTVPMPNFYGVNENLPAGSYTYPTPFHTGWGWKLNIEFSVLSPE
jgi:hypothetical protein